MPVAAGSRTQLRYKLEGTNNANFGVVNTVGGPIDLRRTDDSLAFKVQTQVSQEVRADRMTTDLIVVGAAAEGTIDFELSYNEYDPLLEAALMGAWSVYGTNGVGATFSAATFTTSTITGAALPITNLARGQFVRVIAPSTPNNNRIAQISRTVAPTATLITFEGTPFAAVGTSTANCVIQTSRLINGTTLRSFSFERDHSDIGDRFVMFRGMNIAKLSLNFQSGSIVTGQFDLMGRDQLSPTTTSGFTGGASAASKTFDVMNAVSGVGNILEGGAALSGTFIKSLSLELDNGLRGRDAIGVLGNAEIAPGPLMVTGKMSVYFANKTLFDKFINNTATSLSLSTQDGAGNGYVISMPRVEYNEGTIVSGNRESDSMVEMGFTATMDTATGVNHMIAIDRVGVAAT